MGDQSINIIGEAYKLVLEEDRATRLCDARRLAGIVRSNLGKFSKDLVQGEAGSPDWHAALSHLVERSKLHPIEAWMVAETVATGVVSAHEIANLEPVTDERLEHLTEHLALGALALSNYAYHITWQ